MSRLTLTFLPTPPAPTGSAHKNCPHHNFYSSFFSVFLVSLPLACFAWVLLPPALDSAESALYLLTLGLMLDPASLVRLPRLPFLVHLLYSLTFPYDRVPRSNRPPASLTPASCVKTLVLETTHAPSQKLSRHLPPPHGLRGGRGGSHGFVPWEAC